MVDLQASRVEPRTRVVGVYGSDTNQEMMISQTEAQPLHVGIKHWHKKEPKEDVCLVTPFAGKDYCFNNYLQGIKHLPTNNMSAIWYDNSNDESFQKKLIETGKRLFADFTLLVDSTPETTIENTEQYKDISWRCHQIYKTIEKHLNNDKLTFVVEDDTEIPSIALDRLKRILNENPKVGTAVGSVNSRRMKDRTFTQPNAWRLVIRTELPPSDFSSGGSFKKVEQARLIAEKPYGTEIIGTSHIACWLTWTKLIKKIGFKWYEDGVSANDCVWGYRLMKAGYYTMIDWSVKCKHWWKLGDEKGYF